LAKFPIQTSCSAYRVTELKLY